jgi:hypothetical protein
MELANTVAGLQAQLRQTRRTQEDEDATGSARVMRGPALSGMNKQEFGPVLTAAADVATPSPRGTGIASGGGSASTLSSALSGTGTEGVTNPLRQQVSFSFRAVYVCYHTGQLCECLQRGGSVSILQLRSMTKSSNPLRNGGKSRCIQS